MIPDSPNPPNARPGRVRWFVLALLVAMSFVAYLLRTSMSVAGLTMMDDLGLTQIQLGAILAAFTWAYALFQFPGGIAGDLFGSRRLLAWIAVSWGIVNVTVGLVPGVDGAGTTVILGSLIVAWFAMGVVQAPLFPTMQGAIRNWFPPGGWALPTGMTSTGLTLGGAATGPVIAWLTLTVGWRLSFLLTAPLAVLIGCVWWRWSRDFPTEHPRVGSAEAAYIQAGRVAIEEEPGAWKLVLRDRNILLLATSYFLMNYVFYFFFTWFFIYLVEERGFEVLEGGFLAALPWLAGAVAATAGGAWSDTLARSRGIRIGCRLPCLISLPLVAALLWGGAVAPNPYVAVALLALCFGGTQLTEGPYWSALTAVAGRHTSAAAGILNTGGNAVGGFVALLTPFLAARFGWLAALGVGSLMALLAAALWLFIRADEPMRQARRAV